MLDFITVVNVFWLILVASVVHVSEEYFGGFVDMMQKYGPMRAMTKGLFVAVNAVFVFLCILAAVINAVDNSFELCRRKWAGADERWLISDAIVRTHEAQLQL